MTSCAVTGHRPQKFPWGNNEKDSRCVELKSALTSQIEELVRNGVTDFLSGLAQEILSAPLDKYMNEGLQEIESLEILSNDPWTNPRGDHDGCRRGSQAQCYGLMDTKPNGIEKVEFS